MTKSLANGITKVSAATIRTGPPSIRFFIGSGIFLSEDAGFNPERRFSSLSKEIVIPNSTVTKVIDDLTYANGPGVHFVLIGFANEKQPTVMSTVDPEGLNKLLNWLLQKIGRASCRERVCQYV